jgi:hypothetical protein
MTDRELLELAAKAEGIEITGQWSNDDRMYTHTSLGWWNPLVDDGDALRLAVKLGLEVFTKDDPRAEASATTYGVEWIMSEPHGADPFAATRRAIVRAAASMAPMKEHT